MFAVEDGVPVGEVLDQWSDRLAEEFDAVRLFDLPVGGAIYRVFLITKWYTAPFWVTPSSSWPVFRAQLRMSGSEAGSSDSISRT